MVVPNFVGTQKIPKDSGNFPSKESDSKVYDSKVGKMNKITDIFIIIFSSFLFLKEILYTARSLYSLALVFEGAESNENGLLPRRATLNQGVLAIVCSIVFGACVIFKFYYFNRCKAWKDNYPQTRTRDTPSRLALLAHNFLFLSFLNKHYFYNQVTWKSFHFPFPPVLT